MTDLAPNRYLAGQYAPVDVERTDLDLEVTGTLPAELDGRYLRNGPNPVHPPDPATHHWFIGDGMVHGIRLEAGRARWYRNRWVRSTAVSEAMGEAAIPGDRLGFEGANTNVIGQGGRTFAIVEGGGRPVELTEGLESVCVSDLDGTLAHGYSAHPKRDPATGELHAIGYYWARPEVVEYTVVDTAGHVRHRLDVPVAGGPMMHDCSLTETFVAMYDLPVTFDITAAAEGSRFPYTWNPDHHARVGLVPRSGGAGDVEWYDVDPCFIFHPMNAFDDGDRVVLDVVRHPKMFDADRRGPNEGPSTLWRWTIDRAAGRVHEEQIDDRAIEFPRVDERLVGRPNRFGWAAHMAPGHTDLPWHDTQLVRYDRQTGAVDEISFGPGRSAGEAVFVPRSADAAEDDGWYLTLVYDQATDRSDLVVLDASAPGAGPVATVHLPARVPVGFHGNWVPTGQ